jgi:Ca2+-binding RTX toxin-like protein
MLIALTETLESRRMLSVAASVGAGTLYVWGDDSANSLLVDRRDDNIIVKKLAGAGATYTEVYRTKESRVQNIQVYARGGDDAVTVVPYINAKVTLSGGAGADYLKGGGTECVLYGHDFVPTTDDGAADTLVAGSLGQCIMYGQRGNDQFYFGRPEVVGHGGNDLAYGGSGDDTFHTYRDDRDRHDVIGGAGSDTVDFTDYGYQAHIVLGGGQASGAMSGSYREINYKVRADVENAIGTPYNDHIEAGAGVWVNNRIFGGDGQDHIDAGLGDDYVDGGNDFGDFISETSVGNDTIYGGDGNDQITAGAGDDLVYGGKGLDEIDGEQGNDKLYGQGGDDTVIGGAGIDRIVGGSGNDNLIATDNTPGDIIFGGNTDGLDNGNDRAQIDDPNGVLRDFVFAVDIIV